jgi:hypothetical protein
MVESYPQTLLTCFFGKYLKYIVGKGRKEGKFRDGIIMGRSMIRYEPLWMR